METFPKVLVGTVTYEGHEYVLDRFIASLKKLDYPNYDIVVVYSGKSDKYFDKLRVIDGIKEVVRVDYTTIWANRKAKGLNYLRDYVIYSSDYQYLFQVDSDIILPKDTLTKLVSTKKQLIGPPVPIGLNPSNRVPCVFKDFKWKAGSVLNYMSWDEIGTEIREVAATGLGCLLIDRDVLKIVKFKNVLLSVGWAPDVTFLTECAGRGYKFYVDPSIKVDHIQRKKCWKGVNDVQDNELDGRIKEIKDAQPKDILIENEFESNRSKLSEIAEKVEEYDLIERGKELRVWI